MKLPRYWAKGSATTGMRTRNPATGQTAGVYACWGWSDVSADEAEARGKQRADASARIAQDGKPPDRYLYGDRPLREEILDEWKADDATTYAAITRNAYGCQVLNTASIMFVDVDLPEPSASSSLMRGLGGLFGKRGPTPREQQETDAVAKVDDMVRRDAHCGVRVYRTRGGLRYLFTHSHAEPGSQSTLAIMNALGADPLYVRLCKTHECFRARLTPKPWRCGMSALRVRYPWPDGKSEGQARDWTKEYEQKSERYATCKFLKHLGQSGTDAEIDRVVGFHDEKTRAMSGLDLA